MRVFLHDLPWLCESQGECEQDKGDPSPLGWPSALLFLLVSWAVLGTTASPVLSQETHLQTGSFCCSAQIHGPYVTWKVPAHWGY